MENFNELEFINNVITKIKNFDRNCYLLDLLFEQYSKEFDNDFIESVQDLTYEQLMLFLNNAKKSVSYVYLFRALVAWVDKNVPNMKSFTNDLKQGILLSLNDDNQEIVFNKALEYINANLTHFHSRKEVMS